MRAFFFSLAAFLLSACSMQPAYADILPTPAPSPGTHIPTWQSQQGCYHNTNGACPAPSPNSTAQANTDYQNYGKHVDYLQGDQRNANYAQQGGIHEMPYLDPGLVHGAAPSTYPVYLAATDVNGYQMFLPNNNTSTGGSLVGNPLSAVANSFWATQCSLQLDNNFGKYGFSNCFLDDQIMPWEQYSIVCEGSFAVSSGPYTCASGSTQNAASPLLTHSAYPNPYPAFWLRSLANLYTAMPVPVFLNFSPMDPSKRAYWYGSANNNNIEGVTCEACIGRNPFASDAWNTFNNWVNSLNSEIIAEQDGIKFVAYDLDATSTSDMLYNYASVYLGMLDPKLTIVYEEWDSPLTAPATSNSTISNLAYLVPTGAYGPNPSFDPVSSNYNPTSPNLNVGIGNFLTSTGAYAREFSDCYLNAVDQGPCAAVVNPTASSVAWPQASLRQVYTHTVSGVNANGVVWEFGDNAGMLNLPSLTGSAPPSTLSANSAVIAFQ